MSLQPSEIEESIRISTGESLYRIAQEHLGDAAKWRELAQLNDLDIFQDLNIGGLIDIPKQEILQRVVSEVQQRIDSDLDLSAITNAVNNPWSLLDWIL